MNMTEPLYRGEAILLNWNDNKSGRKIVLQIEKDGPGPHPFDGMDGERFAVVIVGPLASAEHTEIETTDGLGTRRKVNLKFMGDGADRETCASQDDETVGVSTASAVQNKSPAKPKKRWHEMPPSQRAALLVQDPEFERFASLHANYNSGSLGAKPSPDLWLKHECHVSSKSQIVPGAWGHKRFIDIELSFRVWRQARQHGAA